MTRRGRAFLSGLAVVFLFCLPLLPEIAGSRRLIFRDAHMTHWPWRRVAMQMLASEKVPFVNDTASGGQPLLANPNAVLLYPTVLLERVFPPAAAFNLHYLLHVLWAFFGARALASRFGLPSGPAFFAGIAYAFSGAMLSYGSAFANAGPAAAWLPWCAAATIDLVRAEAPKRVLGAACAAGLAFGLQLLAGEPAISLLTLVFCAVIALAGWLGARGSRADRGARGLRIAAGGLLAGGVAAALAAPLFAPLSEVVRLTYRGQHLYSERAFGASPFGLWRVAEWFFPRLSGDPAALAEGAHWQYRLHEGDFVYLWSVTFGVLPLAAVVLGATRRDFWSSKTLLLAGAAAVTLILSFGFATPLYRLLYAIEPLRRFRYPIKFYLLTTLCFALLSGFAVESLRVRRPGAVEKILLMLAALAYALALFAAAPGGFLDRVVEPHLAGLSTPAESLLPVIRRLFRGDALLGIAAIAFLGVFVFAKRPRRGGAHVLGLAALVLALPWGLPLFVSADQKNLARPPALARFLKGDGRLYAPAELAQLAVLETRTSHPELRPTFGKLARVQIEELIPATAAPFGVRYLFDEDPDGSYGWVNRIAGEVLTASKPEERARLVRLYGGRWALGENETALPGFDAVTGLDVAGHRLVLYRADSAAPELRWASRVHRRRSLSGALELARSDLFRPATDVVLPGSLDSAPRETGTGPAASLSIRALEPDHAIADVVAPAAGHVVWSRTFFPAWKASLDGRPVRALLANGRDIAVEVPAGRHRVEVAWNPHTFRLGVGLQAAALLFALAVVAISLAAYRAGARPRWERSSA
jgi:hypothetical protein